MRLPTLAGGLAILSRHPIIGHRFLRYPWRGPLRKELLSRKGILTARISIDDRILTVVNTHLSANVKADWSRGNRFATTVQRHELRTAAATVRRLDSGDPVLLVGDFNVPRDSWLFADFVTASGLVDTLNGAPETTFRPTGSWPGAALDQILVSPGVTADPKLVFQDDEVQLPDGRTTYLSDHYGIAATICFADPHCVELTA
jgi:endonuclease/exonuclease/phosphatase family metal-dependent hydrolase